MQTKLFPALLLLALAGCGGAGNAPAPAAVTPPPAPVPVLEPGLMVFMGDSITFRWATEVLVPGSINKGVPGETPCQMVTRFQADVLDLHPARVHILGGANGIDYEASAVCVLDMAARSVAAGIKTYVGTVTPGKDRDQAGIEYLNNRIRVAAPALGFTVVDYYPAMIDQGVYFNQALYLDTVHPNAAGYARMEAVFEATVR